MIIFQVFAYKMLSIQDFINLSFIASHRKLIPMTEFKAIIFGETWWSARNVNGGLPIVEDESLQVSDNKTNPTVPTFNMTKTFFFHN
jgi:hypothetical protein